MIAFDLRDDIYLINSVNYISFPKMANESFFPLKKTMRWFKMWGRRDKRQRLFFNEWATTTGKRMQEMRKFTWIGSQNFLYSDLFNLIFGKGFIKNNMRLCVEMSSFQGKSYHFLWYPQTNRHFFLAIFSTNTCSFKMFFFLPCAPFNFFSCS